jgi:superfamily I DNA and/or RNA helicase
LRAVCSAAEEAGLSPRLMQKADEEGGYEHAFVRQVDSNGKVADALAAGDVDVVGGTAWLWSRDEMADLVDTLFVDEAGQVSLANVIAMSGCARNVVLLGDPQQLDQPLQGAHPDGADKSALAHLLAGAVTVPPGRGLFLERTWRMHPRITDYTSALFYEGRLESRAGLERQRVEPATDPDGTDFLSGAGLRWVPVAHDGNTNSSAEEAAEVARIWRSLVGRRWVDAQNAVRPITARDIVIVSPFNAHRLLVQGLLGPEARVGTVDKFQGQEAAVSIYTMATSRPEDAPRGMEFLYSLNRLNVATSRARALAIVVASPLLLDAVAHSPDQLRMANALCDLEERA